MTERETAQDTLQLLMPTAVSLIGIGGLILATPLLTDLTWPDFMIDSVVGAIMISCGVLCGWIERRKKS